MRIGKVMEMAYFICEKQGRCCPHEFYDSIEQAISDSEDGVLCDHLIEVESVRHGRWLYVDTDTEQFFLCNRCKKKEYWESNYCPSCGCRMGLEG